MEITLTEYLGLLRYNVFKIVHVHCTVISTFMLEQTGGKWAIHVQLWSWIKTSFFSTSTVFAFKLQKLVKNTAAENEALL